MFKSGSSSPITALKLSKYCLIALGSHLHENENQPCRSFEAGHCVAVEGMADRKVPAHDVTDDDGDNDDDDDDERLTVQRKMRGW